MGPRDAVLSHREPLPVPNLGMEIADFSLSSDHLLVVMRAPLAIDWIHVYLANRNHQGPNHLGGYTGTTAKQGLVDQNRRNAPGLRGCRLRSATAGHRSGRHDERRPRRAVSVVRRSIMSGTQTVVTSGFRHLCARSGSR